MEWFVLPHVSQGGKAGLGFLSLIICIVRFVCDWCFMVGVRVCLGTTIVVFVFCSTICIVLDLVFLSFELTALISIVTWLFAMVACWFGFFRILLCVLLHHSIQLLSSGASKPFSSNSLSRCDTICPYVPFSKCAWLIDFFR